MIGTAVSHYKITKKLGEGGMGEVFQAEDLTLERLVALKFLSTHLGLDEEARNRFVREAKAASALDHPNINVIYEIDKAPDGRLFIAMPFYEGETVSEKASQGPLPVAEALDLIVQVCSGLSKAHAKGIVHRDIKGANIMVTPEGQAKILDFGLAKRIDATKLTATGVSMGTWVYMSPEQAQGKEIDRRTDIWSVGVVLYEMLTGKRPFEGEMEAALLYLIMNQQPEPVTELRPEVPFEIEQVVVKALAKDPEKRYQNLEEMMEEVEELRERLDLLPKRSRMQMRLIRRRRRIAGTTTIVALIALFLLVANHFHWWVAESQATIAVLPCVHLNSDAETAYLGDAITHDIISQLSAVKDLVVINKFSMDRYKGTEKNPREIAAEVGANAVLHSTVRLEGDKLKIALELIDSETLATLWGNRYENTISNILTTWSKVAGDISGALGIRVSPSEQTQLTKTPTVHPEAYRLYQQAMQLTESAMTRWETRGLLEQAVQLDPNFAVAWAELARMLVRTVSPLEQRSYMEMLQKRDKQLEEAREAVNRAFELDPDMAEAYTARGLIMMVTDPQRAEEEFRRAIELKPSYVQAHREYTHLLAKRCRWKEALAEATTTVKLHPNAEWAHLIIARCLANIGDYDRSEQEFKKSLELDEWGQTYYDLSKLYLITQRYNDAQEAMLNCFRFYGLDTTFIPPLFNAIEGKVPAEKVLPIAMGIEKQFGPVLGAEAYAQIGAVEQTIAALEREILIDRPQTDVLQCRLLSPMFDPVRNDPRFQDFMKRSIGDSG